MPYVSGANTGAIWGIYQPLHKISSEKRNDPFTKSKFIKTDFIQATVKPKIQLLFGVMHIFNYLLNTKEYFIVYHTLPLCTY